MLKRPAEVHWNFRTPPEPYPQTPGANGCFIAPSGMGKTTTLISMLLGPYRHCFDQIHVFSPSVDIDSAWGPVKQFAEHLQGSSFHSEWDEPALRKILEEQKERIKKLKDAKTKKPLPQLLVICDDFADNPMLHSPTGVLNSIFVRGRHSAQSIWVSSQKLTAISTVARVNFRFILCWRLRNQKEIIALMEELSAIYPVKVLHEMYETAVSEPHSFWYINLVQKRKEDMFYIRFEQKMIYD